MSDLIWTTQFPTKPGFYWTRSKRESRKNNSKIVSVCNCDGLMKVVADTGNIPVDCIPYMKWAGPIAEPAAYKEVASEEGSKCKFKAGLVVWSPNYGLGTVRTIDHFGSTLYPVLVHFNNDECVTFTTDGKEYDSNNNPTLFLREEKKSACPFREHDHVWTKDYGPGTVVRVIPWAGYDCPVVVRFDRKEDEIYFTTDGKEYTGKSGPCQMLVLKNNIDTLEPFSKVLVRDSDEFEWRIDFFSHTVDSSMGGDYDITYRCLHDLWQQCIPYDGNEHLLGTDKGPERR